MYLITGKFAKIMLNCEYYNLRDLFFTARRDEPATPGESTADPRKGVRDEYLKAFNRRTQRGTQRCTIRPQETVYYL